MFKKAHSSVTRLISVAALITLSSASQAAVTFYDNEANFNAAYTGTLNLEGFESFTTGDTVISTPDFTLTSSDGGSINEFYLGVYATEGVNYFGWAYTNNATVTFNFDNPIDAFGVDITDLASASDTAINFMNDNGDGFDVIYPYFLSHGALDFFGVTSDIPFSSLTLTFEAGEWAGLDRVQFGSVVPVPAAFWLLASGLIALTGVARKKHI